MSVSGCIDDPSLGEDQATGVKFESDVTEDPSVDFAEPALFRDGIEVYPQAGTSIDHEQLAARDGYATSIIDSEGKSWEIKVASGVFDQDFSEGEFTKSAEDGPIFYHKTTEQFADIEPDCIVYIDAGNGLYAALRRSIYEGACPTTGELATWLPYVATKTENDGLETKQAALSFGAYTGSFSGVNSYSNWDSGYYCPDFKPWSQCTSHVGSELAGVKWQCMEYADRYYLAVYKHTNLWKGHAKYWYDKAAQYGLKRFPNCGKNAPHVGDMIVSNGGDFGHIAIVRAVGLGSITVIQQNWAQNSQDNNFKLPMVFKDGEFCVGGFVGKTIFPIKGWIRK